MNWDRHVYIASKSKKGITSSTYNSNEVYVNVVSAFVDTTTDITVSPNSTLINSQVTVSATTTTANGDPAPGHIKLYVGESTVPFATIENGGSVTVTAPSVLGNVTYRAVYEQTIDNNIAYRASNDSTLLEVTNKQATTTTVELDDYDVYVDDTVTITPTVKVGNTVIDFGEVEILVNGLSYANITAGTSTSYTANVSGQHNISARYKGSSKDDIDYLESSSGNVVLNVNKYDVHPTISVSNVTYGSPSVATISSDVAGAYDVYIDGEHFIVTLTDNKLSDTISVSKNAGNYSASVSFNSTYKYNEASATTLFHVNEGTINLSVVADNVVYPTNASAVISTNVSGNYEVFVDGVSFANVTIDSSDGLTLDLGQKGVGDDYNVTVVSKVDNYAVAEGSDLFNVTAGAIELSVVADNVMYPSNVTARILANVSGTYEVFVDGVSKGTIELTANNESEFDLGVYNAGENYNVTVTSRIDNYAVVSDSDLFNVSKAGSQIIKVTNDTVVYDADVVVNVTAENATDINITVKNGTEVICTNDDVTIIQNGENDFTVVISGLNEGNYTIDVVTIPDSNHNVSDVKTGNIEVLPDVHLDVVKVANTTSALVGGQIKFQYNCFKLR